MSNMYHTPPIFSSYSPPPEQPSDDISLLLRQILFKSSSSSSSSSSPFLSSKLMKSETQPQQPPPTGAANNIPVNVIGHVASSSVGTVDYDPDEYDSEGEEGLEHLMGEMVAKPNPPRNPSKRTRAAEVHNMSEKRRRSRINEKMKALQKLIPNSNKSDKASMLDEAIEYLKQLQLQVQMLTMRNGISLYSMCAPHDVLQPNLRPSGMNHGNQPINMTASHGALVNPMLSQNQPSILDFSRTMNQEPSFGTQLGSS
ncbi:hypothetical protein L1987_66093 [Smallanthus sonchifolius]|uniref:Uncharacterized protein n=1 Tax=Smallanthus sonchifolius TaxID=185202 RepID=A0ACB9BWB1_9ASTR|nr:hypothetical protein L1987_66093 [Smallanthus sonchifolius]